jgi:flagellar hook-basal body complex protein FliE
MRIDSFASQFKGVINGASGAAEATSTGHSFGQELQSKISEVNQLQQQSEAAMQDGAVRGASRIDETMIQLEQADISLRLLVKVRNKAVEAYQELMRMQF